MESNSHTFSVLFILFTYSLSTPTVNGLFSSASFYGNSFMFEQLTDLSSDTTVSMQFQTQAPDGVLLLAAGQQDYFIVSLKNGRLEIRMNVGAGEAVIESPAGVRYNNQLWHKVDILRIGSRLDLRVNDNGVASGTIWTTENDDVLEIDLGVFLGGYDLKIGAAYLEKSLPFFRGCILTADFNSADVLDPLRSIDNLKIVYNIEAGCSKLFHARKNDPVSFESINSYIQYRRWTSTNAGTFECLLRTVAEDGLILFNSGWRRQEFVGLEMVGGTIRASMNRGSGSIGLQSTQSVNDGNWHRIRFSFSPTILEIRVDRNRTKVFVEQTDLESDSLVDDNFDEIHLKGPLFVGGVDTKTKNNKKILSNGLRLDSFPGCFKNIRVNYRPKSFGDMVASHDVSVGCKTPQSFTSTAHVRIRQSQPTFLIIPHRPSTTSVHRNISAQLDDDSDRISKIKRKLEQKVCYNLTSHGIDVLEGGSTNITKEIVIFKRMSKKNNRRLSNNNAMSVFTFRIVSLPQHGMLLRNGDALQVNDAILMTIITNNELTYVHDGSETQTDTFSFSIGQVGKDSPIRKKDLKKYKLCNESFVPLSNTTVYSINVTVVPTDDPPALHIPSNYVFEPIRNARTPLPKKIFKAVDADSPPSKIIYHILGVVTGLYIESKQYPGRPINKFTQKEINQKKINFVHAEGPDNTRLLIQVSNSNISDANVRLTSVLRISTRHLQITITNNTGLTLVEGEAMILTENHLTSTTNAESSEVDVEYHIQDGSVYGQLQVLMGDDGSNGAWTVASSFHQSYIEARRVRYLNIETSDEPGNIVKDGFGFVATGSDVEVGPFTFNITILRVVVTLNTLPITLKGSDTIISLTLDHLNLDYTGLTRVTDDEIQFVILKAFNNGALIYSDTGLEISSGDAFTLSELKSGRLEVNVFTRQIRTDIAESHDYMRIYGIVRGRYRSSQHDLSLTYILDTKSIKITSVMLLVDEGGEARITPDHLFAQTLLHRRFLFQLTRLTQHGVLKLRQVTGSSTVDEADTRHQQDNVTSFTTRDIADGRLHYRHDDSEHARDAFIYTVTPILEGELPDTVDNLRNVTQSGIFNISIQLLNDNSPERVINRPFSIAHNTARLLTRNDLWYHDPDIDQDDLTLKYVRRGISNGEILNATSKRREKIFEFTQNDIQSNSVLFQHKGRDFGRFVFWVKDGKHFATGLFVVTASDPYIHVTNSSKLLVQMNQDGVISPTNIQADTNIVGLRNAINYRVTSPPQYGELLIRKNGVEVATSIFTQRNVDDGELVYRHDGTGNINDGFNYSVTVQSTTVSGNLSIQVYLAIQQQPPVMRRNRIVVVYQATSVTYTRSDLRATHQDVRPRDITYNMRTHPSFGRFIINRTRDVEDGSTAYIAEENPRSFSQWDINQGHVSYTQDSNDSFSSIEPFDDFTFDVSNGILSLSGVTGRIEIIPLLIPLRTSNFTVDEGRSKVLISEYLSIASRHYDNLDIDVMVVRQPIHGRLESSRDTGRALDRFSLRLAQAEFVYYIHDGGDSIQDMFQLKAQTVDGSRESAIATTYVSINPENDQSPQLVNNTGVFVWVNSVTTISRDNLATVDLDTSARHLTYDIIPPLNGHISMKYNPSSPIVNFTQEDINLGHVVFVHRGSNTGGFTFQVNDQLNYDVKHIFVITARPLIITVAPTYPVQVFPSAISQLTHKNLNSKTNDETTGPGARDVTYIVTRQPASGIIVKKSNNASDDIVEMNNTSLMYNEVGTFTQSEIDSGLICYKQNTEVSSWNVTDVIELTATSHPADNVTEITLTFNVTYDAFVQTGRISPIRTNADTSVKEGGSFNFTLHQLDASNLFKKISDPTERTRYDLRYRLMTAPRHGTLSIAGRTLSVTDSFLHKFIEQRIINYTHGGSEEPRDSFVFEAYLRSKKRSDVKPSITLKDTFHIVVVPVNDNPPKLITLSSQLQAVQGFVATLNRTHLLATDVDNPASDITYNLIRLPTYGKLRLVGGNSTLESRPTDSFTQDDIDNNRVLFVQNKRSDTEQYPSGNHIISDAFYFSLTDGFHRPRFSLFRIKIMPVTVALQSKPVYMKQGEFSALLSTHLIMASTNGRVSQLTYRVITSPQAGAIFNGDDEVTMFSYDDIASSRITYVMSDLNHDSDHMTLMTTYNDSEVDHHPNATTQINITVTSLVSTGKFEPSPDGMTPITLRVLDASELANLTGSQPIYHIIQPAVHADVVVNTDRADSETTSFDENRSRRSIQPEVTSFTHDDVAAMRVFLSIGFINMTNLTDIADQFTFRLTVEDSSVQPAIGNLRFKIVPSKNANNTIEIYSEASTEASVEYNTTLDEVGSTSVTMTTSDPRDATTRVLQDIATAPASNDDGDDVDTMEVEKMKDSSVPWLILLIIALCILVVVIIIVAVVCLCRRNRKKQGPAYIKGHEAPILRAPSAPAAVTPIPQQATIGATAVVKVTSRAEPIDQSERCPTASVVVTPLHTMPRDMLDDDETDDGYYGDGYISNSMPHESVLARSGMPNFSVARGNPGASFHGFNDLQTDASRSMDFGNVPTRTPLDTYPDVAGLYSSDESIGPEVNPPRRNASMGTLPFPNGSRDLSAAPLPVNQYWV